MEINDKYIKDLLETYQKTQEGFPVILEYLSLFIYYFPRLVSNNCDEDILGEYYDYFLERLPKALQLYSPIDGVLFKTWFFLVQKRHYLNFLKFYQKPTIANTCEYMESFSLDTVGVAILSADHLAEVAPYISKEDLLFLKLFSPENLNRQDFYSLLDMLQCDFDTLIIKIRILFDYVSIYHDKHIVKLVPINKVAEFLDWHRLKVAKKLNQIRETMQKKYTWENE